MSSPRRQSPRAAIQEWLSHTDKAVTIGTLEQAKSQKEKGEGHEQRRLSPRRSHGGYGLPHFGRENPRHAPDGHCDGQPPRASKATPRDHTKKSKDSRNLAEQLGLHAPFRSLANRNEDVRNERQRENGRRKRTRSLSTTSSFLEPADHLDNTGRNLKSKGNAGAKKSQRGRQQSDGSASSRSPSITIVSPDQPVKTYERRKRHKTREDRYELKQEGRRDKSQRSGEKARDKPRKKKKRLQKSGSALMQDFTAGNVKPERLTLKAATPLGLFGKGRASSPIKRKGLPDLTFSEINFLSHRRGEQEGTFDTAGKKSRRKKDKAVDTEAEISRFFASSKDQEHKEGGTAKHRGDDREKKRANGRAEEQEGSSLPPVDLPERPFLGFGSCGPGNNSPIVPIRASVSRGDDRVPSGRRSPSSRSTTYYTWSRSSVSRNRRFCERSKSSRRSREEYRTPQDTPDIGGRANSPERSPPANMVFGKGADVSSTPSTRSDSLKRVIEDNKADKGEILVPLTDLGHSSRISHEKIRTIIPEARPEQQQKQSYSKADLDDWRVETFNSSKADLISLLAGSSRPEIFGAMLDALMNKADFQNSESRRSPRPSQTVASRGADKIRRPESKHETQIPYEPAHPGMWKPLPMNPSQSHTTDATASSKPFQDGRQAPSLSDSNPPNGDQRPGHSSDVQDPNPFGQDFQTSKQSEILNHDININNAPRITEERPGPSNAWIGYQNLYQSQMDVGVARPQDYEAAPQNNVNEAHQDYSQILQSTHEALGGFPDGHNHRDILEEDHLYDPYPDLQRPTNEGSNRTHYETSHMCGGPHELYQEFQDEMLDVAPNCQEGLSQDANTSLLVHSEGIDSGQYFDGRVEILPRFPATDFLGGRGFATVDPDQGFSLWSPRIPSITQNSDVLPTRGSITGMGAMEEAPSTGFWKPNRLY
ncbi:MAG: hypothetical protein Q9181_007639 [Wetmoreana brouardii]